MIAIFRIESVSAHDDGYVLILGLPGEYNPMLTIHVKTTDNERPNVGDTVTFDLWWSRSQQRKS